MPTHALDRLLADAVACGVRLYRREIMLRWLLPADLDSADSNDPECTRRLCLHLLAALRRERRRGQSGHWSYDFNRHVGLLQAYTAERQRLREAEASHAKSPAEGPGSERR